MNTTDSQYELFDVVDERNEVIRQVPRGECHATGLIHRTVSALLFNEEGELLIVRRSLTKDIHPGLWGFSMDGHVRAGVSFEETAKQEFIEELGVSVNLEPIGTIFIDDPADRQWKRVFRGRSNGPFRFNPVETAGHAWMTMEQIEAKVRSGETFFTPVAIEVLRQLFFHEIKKGRH